MKKLITIMSSIERVFIDSGIIIGFFSGEDEVVKLFDKLHDNELCICDVVFSEVVYKLMALKYSESIEKFKFHEFKKNLLNFVYFYDLTLKFIKDAELVILPVTKEVVTEASKIGKVYNLLPNDALIASTCRYYGINKIATSDDDFKRVDFLEVINLED